MHAEPLQSRPTLCDPMDYTHQAPLSVGFSRQESWSGVPCLSPGDLPQSWIEPGSPALQADTLTSEPPGKPLVDEPVITLKSGLSQALNDQIK